MTCDLKSGLRYSNGHFLTLRFWQKNQNFDVSKTTTYKIGKQLKYLCVIKLYASNTCKQIFEPLSVFLAVQWSENQVFDDVTFLNTPLAFLAVLRQSKWYFWNTETKLDKICMFLLKVVNYKFDLISPEFGLPSGQIKKWTSLAIMRPKWPIKHVLHVTHKIFSLGGLIWPGLHFDLPFTYGLCLNGTFVSFERDFYEDLARKCNLSRLDKR